jgi:DNA primase
MRGDVDTIKEKLDITEVVSGYVKLEKAGQSFKARCPFHNEKTPSFFVSPLRQSFYCFGCGVKGDIFTFIQEIEGLEFREALKFLAEKAGVELEYQRSESRTEKDKVLGILEEATSFFEKELMNNKSALAYIASRGISDETIKKWRIGYIPGEWRLLYNHLQSLGFDKELIFKAGLIKLRDDGGEPYDVFRDRIIFPLFDQNSRVIAFSGRALSKDTEPARHASQSEAGGPKYLNSPDTMLFTKSEVLYGLDKAKTEIRKKDYAVLVEGQMDLVLSCQAGVLNTVAVSGTAFTEAHLERLRHLSSRIILAFDADIAGEKAAEKASLLGIHLGFEVKVADLPEGKDPAEIVKKNPQEWKEVLRQALPAVEFFFNKVEGKEKDSRKLGKQIEKKILPMIKLIKSAIEQSHFISMLAKRTGIREEILWEDLKRVRLSQQKQTEEVKEKLNVKKRSRADEYREVTELLKENSGDKDLAKHREELSILMRIDELDEKITLLRLNIDENDEKTLKKLDILTRERDEERRKML